MKEGICCECGEHTSVEDSCCGSGVWCEGDIAWPSDECRKLIYEPKESEK